MDKFAALSPDKREEAFSETAKKMGLSVRIVEKDFWVCWTLNALFSIPEIKGQLIFKGGTSLSKGFNLISRFSEDIEVSIKRDFLGFTGENDLENQKSKTQQKKSVDALREKGKKFVSEEIYSLLTNKIEQVLGSAKKGWKLEIDKSDFNTILFSYPTVVASSSTVLDRYIEPVIRIEFGTGSDNFPIGEHSVTSYVATDFQHLFSDPNASVAILELVRTFWEKASLLHAEYHRPETSPTPFRLSRHYYDIFCLAGGKLGREFIKEQDVLSRVIKHKSVFFPSGWTHNETAVPGTLKLFPHERRVGDLLLDYRQMQEMFFNTPPQFEVVLEKIKELEEEINGKK